MLLACVIVVFLLALFFFYGYRDHRDLHSFPTRRSSDLADSRVRSCEELSESLARFALINSQIDPHVLLARFRRRELLRTYLHDIRRTRTIVETTEELSNLADAVLGFALKLSTQELDNRHGVPQVIDDQGRI